jgi:hypothetical protein
MSKYLMPCPLRSKQYCTVEQLARECLAEAGNDPRQAFRLASNMRGARLRAVTARIGSALLRRSVS